MRLTKKVATLIAAERVCRVATAGRNGRPHVVPVCPAVAGQKIYFGSGKDAGKYPQYSKEAALAAGSESRYTLAFAATCA